jgi:hypothetical protein
MVEAAERLCQNGYNARRFVGFAIRIVWRFEFQ